MTRNVYITYSNQEYQYTLICKTNKLSIQVVIYTSLITVLFYYKIKHQKSSYTSLLHIITSPKAQSFIRTLHRVLLNWLFFFFLQIQTTTDHVVFILKRSIQEHPCSSNLPLFKDHYRQHAKIISFILDKKCCWNLEKIDSRYLDYIAQNLRLEPNRNIGFYPRGQFKS